MSAHPMVLRVLCEPCVRVIESVRRVDSSGLGSSPNDEGPGRSKFHDRVHKVDPPRVDYTETANAGAQPALN